MCRLGTETEAAEDEDTRFQFCRFSVIGHTLNNLNMDDDAAPD